MRERLIVALDVADAAEAVDWVRLLRHDAGVFKIGLELFISQGPAIIEKVRQAGAAELFLDLKLHDIPATMRAAAQQAAALGVDFLTCHCEQEHIFSGLELGKTRLLGVTILTSLNSEDLVRQGYTGQLTQPLALARQRGQIALAAGCHGVVCSAHEAGAMRELLGRQALIVCPGIRLAGEQPDDQKRVSTPAAALGAGASHIVAGRPILRAQDPAAAARAFVREMESAANGKYSFHK
jgi:orotidine-5'-phosphate decarboxylase